MDKILITAPTAAAKNYCFIDWLDNVMSFSYPNTFIRLFENTLDGGVNAQHLNSLYDKRYADEYGKDRFIAQNTVDGTGPVTDIERMCISMNHAREYAILEGYTHVLWLETDVFPPADIIESLLFHQKKVVGAIYYRDEGLYRKPMLQRKVARAPNNYIMHNFAPAEDTNFLDGSLKKVGSVGLGCVLISIEVLKRIPFRFERGVDMHPDSYFGGDCDLAKIDIFADTSKICRHENRPWGVFGQDYR